MSEYDAAFQGAPGAFSEEAAVIALGVEARLLPCATFDELFDAVCDGRAELGVVPVENSIAGPVAPAVRLLAERPVVVEGELTIRIAQALVGPPGASLETVRRVRSHPVALAQCSRFFASRPHLAAVEDFDTAGAVERVVGAGSVEEAAIASARPAAIYGGVVLATEIQDTADNRTRFVVVRLAE
jgi:prephenate dehydratase